MNGIPTRNFKNFIHPDIQEQDFSGPRTLLGNQYKLVIHGGTGEEAEKELFDINADPAEENNILSDFPEIADNMEKALNEWQQSVLESLIGNDYP